MNYHHSPSATGPLDSDSAPGLVDSYESLNALAAQCNDAASYPRNVPLSGHQEYAIALKYRQLNEQAPRLFCGEKKAQLDFFEFNEGGQG